MYVDYDSLHMDQKAHVACNFNRIVEIEGLFKITSRSITTEQQHLLNGPLTGTMCLTSSRKVKHEARDTEWQWHQLGHFQICTSPRQITTPAPQHSVSWIQFLPPNQQRQSTEGIK